MMIMYYWILGMVFIYAIHFYESQLNNSVCGGMCECVCAHSIIVGGTGLFYGILKGSCRGGWGAHNL